MLPVANLYCSSPLPGITISGSRYNAIASSLMTMSCHAIAPLDHPPHSHCLSRRSRRCHTSPCRCQSVLHPTQPHLAIASRRIAGLYVTVPLLHGTRPNDTMPLHDTEPPNATVPQRDLTERHITMPSHPLHIKIQCHAIAARNKTRRYATPPLLRYAVYYYATAKHN